MPSRRELAISVDSVREKLRHSGTNDREGLMDLKNRNESRACRVEAWQNDVSTVTAGRE